MGKKTEMKCRDCGATLTRDEIGLNKKLISLETQEFLCLECLGESLGCSVDDLRIKIEEFKDQGCALF